MSEKRERADSIQSTLMSDNTKYTQPGFCGGAKLASTIRRMKTQRDYSTNQSTS
ncbi:hypothetical protein PROFUN_09846 [Planoprotostelium fungivorum]|uniref:Uncharacterized protein n=1 Tax=Planoprotostelium fungivorum TaxID=1890364 RepID=A0A2P6NFR0_9EUKA|nr:hypothetical protein PROFUN_09846 [Planoprotostelium fungivorum]